MATELRHKYAYEIDLADENTAAAHVVRLVGRNKRVLDVGSGPGAITRYLKDPGDCSIVAIEVDPAAATLVAPFCEQVLHCDLDNSTFTAIIAQAGKFDVVVMADILEHLKDPWKVLVQMKEVLRDGGYLVVSLPHAGHNAVIASLLNADFEYRDTGLLDRTHIRFFAMRNIQALFEQAGLRIVDAGLVARQPEASELAHHWSALPERLQDALSSNRFGAVYQVVVRAEPQQGAGSSIDLCALPMPQTREGWWKRNIGRGRRKIAASLHPSIKAPLKRALTLLGLMRR